MTTPPENAGEPIRVLYVQPSLASYRAPVYRELAARPGIDLRVWYGDYPTIKNVEPEGFDAELKPMKLWRLGGQEAMWHEAQVEAARQEDADVILLAWSARYMSLGPALRTAKQRGLPTILWGHGVSKSENAFRRWCRDRIANLATVLLFYDDVNAGAAIKRGVPEDRVFVAPNSMDQTAIIEAREAWNADPSRMEAFREEHSLNDRSVLLFVSRFTPENRLDLLVEAIDRVRRERPEVLVVLVGGGAEEQRVKQLIDERGLADHFLLTGPIYDQLELAPWFLVAEAFVYPSTIGLSLLHAFGYGLPVITNDNTAGHGPEIVAYQPNPEKPGANGLDYATGDSADLADSIVRILGDQPLRDRLAAGALETVERRYNVGKMVDGMVAAINRCVR